MSREVLGILSSVPSVQTNQQNLMCLITNVTARKGSFFVALEKHQVETLKNTGLLFVHIYERQAMHKTGQKVDMQCCRIGTSKHQRRSKKYKPPFLQSLH